MRRAETRCRLQLNGGIRPSACARVADRQPFPFFQAMQRPNIASVSWRSFLSRENI